MAVTTDRRKLKTKRLIVKVEVNERTNQVFVEMGSGLNDVDIFESVVHILNVLAERLDVRPEQVWATLLSNFKGVDNRDL